MIDLIHFTSFYKSLAKQIPFFKCLLHFNQYIKTRTVCFGKKGYHIRSLQVLDFLLTLEVIYRKWMFLNSNENNDMPVLERTLIYQLRL